MQFVLFGVNISAGLGHLVLKLLIAALLCAPGPFLHDNPKLLDTVVCIVPACRQQGCFLMGKCEETYALKDANIAASHGSPPCLSIWTLLH